MRIVGLEFWISIGPDVEPSGEVEAKEFAGGLYAVTTCQGLATIGEDWARLGNWLQSSRYRWRNTHELEKPRDTRLPEREWVFDLYCPIET